MKTHTLGLIVGSSGFEILLDEYEIECLESALRRGDSQPMQEIMHRRDLLQQKENLQAEYIEEMLSRPAAKTTVKEQGALWFRSKLRLDQHRQAESEAAEVIAHYAYQIYQNDPSRTDFLIAGPHAHVRIRIFTLPVAA